MAMGQLDPHFFPSSSGSLKGLGNSQTQAEGEDLAPLGKISELLNRYTISTWNLVGFSSSIIWDMMDSKPQGNKTNPELQEELSPAGNVPHVPSQLQELSLSSREGKCRLGQAQEGGFCALTCPSRAHFSFLNLLAKISSGPMIWYTWSSRCTSSFL